MKKTVRLLPVVIFAAAALLALKGIGLVTNGGYVLSGAGEVQAASGAGGSVAIADTSPTLEDTAPTLPTLRGPEAAPDGDHAAAESVSAEMPSPPAAAETAAPLVVDVACPTPGSQTSAEIASQVPVEVDPADCVRVPVNEHGDAIATTRDADGKLVPLAALGGDNSEVALESRLAERRSEIDRMQAELDMRIALVEAAERRLDERAAALAALEAQVATLVDEKQAAEEAGFLSIVSMYETMKPKDAAKIFDNLELPVLVKVVRAMNPRKMSPILAAMSPASAKLLTAAMAATESTSTVAAVGENLAALPQIIGQ